MKKPSWKAYLITGLCLRAAGMIYVALIAPAFVGKAAPAGLNAVIYAVLRCIGAVLMFLSPAVKHMENGLKKEKKLFDAMSAAHKTFIICVIALYAEFILVATGPETITVLSFLLLFGTSVVCLISFIVFIKDFNREKLRARYDPGLANGAYAGVTNGQNCFCSFCGIMIRNPGNRLADGRVACDGCMTKYNNLHSGRTVAPAVNTTAAPAPQTHAVVTYRCVVCNQAFSSPETRLFCGQRLCFGCMKKYRENDPAAVRAVSAAVAASAVSTGTSVKQFRCFVCGKTRPSPETRLLLGRRICCDCLKKYRSKDPVTLYAVNTVISPGDYGMKSGNIVKKSQKELYRDLAAVLTARKIQLQNREAAKYRKMHTVCEACGAEHPRSMFRVVNGKYYCSDCFDKTLAADKVVPVRKDTPSPKEVLKQFDRAVFVQKFKSFISPRLPRDIESEETQRSFINNLKRLYPGVYVPFEDGQKPDIKKTGSAVDGMLKDAVMQITDGRQTVDTLVDAFILLDYYAYMLQPAESVNVCIARANTAAELQKIIPDR